MPYQYLQSQDYYDDLYDQETVRLCRGGEEIVNNAFIKMEDSIPINKPQTAGWYLEYSKYYFYFVEYTAGSRYFKREDAIKQLMENDEQKDRRLAAAQLSKPPYCRNCGHDMDVFDKFYMHRDDSPRKDGDDVLIMFECPACNKRLTFWEDGTEWEGAKIYCEKCGGVMTSTHKETSNSVISTFNCPDCKHSYKETMDFTTKQEEEETVDTSYVLDKKRFCLDDETMKRLEDKMIQFGRVAKVYSDASERAENADVYDGLKDIKQLKITQLVDAIRPIATKAHFQKFKLGEPQLGREVVIDFSCLDAKSDRNEDRSKRDLKKLITETLEETNWRLMSDGLRYRLGYLSGRLRAYEGDEDLRKLIEQRIKDGTLKPKIPKEQTEEERIKADYNWEKLDKPAYIEAVMAKINLGQKFFDNGTKRPDRQLTLMATIVPNLRVIIPARQDDLSVPGFVREYDFQIISKSKIERRAKPKNTKK